MTTYTISFTMTVDEFPEGTAGDVIAENEAVLDLLKEGLHQVGAFRNGDTLNEHGWGVCWKYNHLHIARN